MVLKLFFVGASNVGKARIQTDSDACKLEMTM